MSEVGEIKAIVIWAMLHRNDDRTPLRAWEVMVLMKQPLDRWSNKWRHKVKMYKRVGNDKDRRWALRGG